MEGESINYLTVRNCLVDFKELSEFRLHTFNVDEDAEDSSAAPGACTALDMGHEVGAGACTYLRMWGLYRSDEGDDGRHRAPAGWMSSRAHRGGQEGKGRTFALVRVEYMAVAAQREDGKGGEGRTDIADDGNAAYRGMNRGRHRRGSPAPKQISEFRASRKCHHQIPGFGNSRGGGNSTMTSKEKRVHTSNDGLRNSRNGCQEASGTGGAPGGKGTRPFGGRMLCVLVTGFSPPGVKPSTMFKMPTTSVTESVNYSATI
ncbi:hypothetical protein DFH07DRAFT_780099 [Mycena maculata]|uniref:Uncharacterized protein n=1 Tax=Mycena maculata TaxID=230809 RepID=A0AAD7I4S4_9AGAR|nr:hypothetical protein DFH07DRAFT_780099 [Mycena maculata]